MSDVRKSWWSAWLYKFPDPARAKAFAAAVRKAYSYAYPHQFQIDHQSYVSITWGPAGAWAAKNKNFLALVHAHSDIDDRLAPLFGGTSVGTDRNFLGTDRMLPLHLYPYCQKIPKPKREDHKDQLQLFV